MLDSRSLHGVLRRGALFAATAFFIAFAMARPALAGELDCGPMAATQNLITALGGDALAPLGDVRATTLRMILTEEPGADQPTILTGRLLAADMDKGRMAIVFAEDDRACGLVLLPEGTAGMLDALERVGALPIGRTL